MKTNFNRKEDVSPVAYIAKNKQRIKQYGYTVYLKNGDEFEIELYNPTSTKVLARIELNNVSIGPGIIIRPGERVFLDRYVTEAKKFLFETYKVNGNNKEVQKAIESNGDVIVKFFKEQNYNIINSNNSGSIWFNDNHYNQPITWTSSTAGTGSGTISSTKLNLTNISNTSSIGATAIGTACCYSSSVPTMDFLSMDQERSVANFPTDGKKRSMTKTLSKSTTKEIETGRVEKGSNSDQTFKADYTKFESFNSWTSEWKLLPESMREVTIDDLVQYCVKDGRKRHKNELYCPLCGTKF